MTMKVIVSAPSKVGTMRTMRLRMYASMSRRGPPSVFRRVLEPPRGDGPRKLRVHFGRQIGSKVLGSYGGNAELVPVRDRLEIRVQLGHLPVVPHHHAIQRATGVTKVLHRGGAVHRLQDVVDRCTLDAAVVVIA